MAPDEEFDVEENVSHRNVAAVRPAVNTTADLEMQVEALTKRVADLEREIGDLRRAIAP